MALGDLYLMMCWKKKTIPILVSAALQQVCCAGAGNYSGLLSSHCSVNLQLTAALSRLVIVVSIDRQRSRYVCANQTRCSLLWSVYLLFTICAM